MPWPFSKKSKASTENEERGRAFLATLQWCSARQQLALEEWNDAASLEAGAQLDDELSPAPLFALTAQNAPRLLPVAERRLTTAQSINTRFGSLEASAKDILAKDDGEWGVVFALAISEWAAVFSLYETRSGVAVQNLRSLVHGTPAATDDEGSLLRSESETMDRAVLFQREVMKTCGIKDRDLMAMMLNATNDLRREIGKPPMSRGEHSQLYARGMAGKAPRFYA